VNDHVFICYSRKDEDFVLKLAANLKSRGVPIWLDQWEISSGANWNRTIEKALEESTRLLLILSTSSVTSDEVQCEWLSAIDENKVVIPILYQPCHIPHRLKPIQYIDFTSRDPDNEEAVGQILKALGIAIDINKKPVTQLEQPPEEVLNDTLDSPKVKNISDTTKSNEFQTKTEKRNKNIRIYGAIAAIVIISLISYFYFSNQSSDTISGRYSMNEDMEKIATISHLSGNQYSIGQLSGPWPYKGVLTLDGDHLFGLCMETGNAATFNFDGVVLGNRTIQVDLRYITDIDGRSAQGRVDPHLFIPVPAH